VKTKYLVSAVVAAAFVSVAAWAESLPLKSVNKAGEVIDAALEAHGGAEAIADLNTVVRTSTFINVASGQSRSPGPPWDRGKTKSFSALNLEEQIFVTKNVGEGGGFVFDGSTIINGEESRAGFQHAVGSIHPRHARPVAQATTGPSSDLALAG
jgi:hypothetical protein